MSALPKLPYAWYRLAEDQHRVNPPLPVVALSIGFERASSRAFQWTSRQHDRFHPRWHLVQFSMRGHGLFHPGGKHPSVRLEPGMLALLSKDVPGAYGCEGDLPWDFFYFKFTGPFADDAVARIQSKSPVMDVGLKSPLAAILVRLLGGLHGGGMGRHAIAVAAFEFVLRLVEISDAEGRKEKDWLANLRQRIQHDIAGVSVKALAAEAEVSLGHFEERFKTAAGMTPHQFIIQERIQAATTLLSGTGKRVLEVARLCGFEDAGYFSKVFRKHLGATPEAWRSWHR